MNKFLFSTEFIKRIISSFVLIMIALLSLLSNNYILIGVLIFLIIILTYEWLNITENLNNKFIILTKTLLNICIFLLGTFNIAWSILFLLLITIINLITKNNPRVNSFYVHIGPLYLCLPLIFLYNLYIEPNDGVIIVIWCLLVVWFTDTFAYIGGNIFKGKKLCPKLSPNKTISGSLSGIIGAIFVSYIVFHYTKNDIFNYMIFGLLVSIAAQLGDLFESYIKRVHAVDNSSNLIPGHGGILDRLDSSLAAFCFVFIFYKLVL